MKYMKLALELAKKGNPSPNPYVGAVLAKNGEIIGRGFHRRAGEAHAEINALAEAGKNAKGATLYVTLEPCSHTDKRTPPCTRAIIAAGVKKVVVAMEDPQPKVRGIEELREAGVEVEVGVMAEEARELNRPFAKYITTGFPFVTLKCAMTLDGKISGKNGARMQITGREAVEYAHKLRDENDAVLVGIGTILSDNPKLTCRIPGGRDPTRVVLDSALKIPLDANVLADSNVVIATTEKNNGEKKRELEKKGVRVWILGGDYVEFRALVKKLASEGMTSVLVEGGAGVYESAVESGLVDRFVFFIAPKISGEETARDAFKKLPEFEVLKVKKLGRDVLVEATLIKR
jgi:diaminohydroxyphosphoribosylaminopyrimidine deaminase/5-amino-6-(5-phosphoribosylamino)uracil reductase